MTNGAVTWYVEGGKLDTTFTGLGKDGDKWIVAAGKLCSDYSGTYTIVNGKAVE